MVVRCSISGRSGLKNSDRLYTEDENKQIRNLYPTHTAAYIGKLLNRSPDAIQLQARRLGIPRKNRTYTRDEDKVIIKSVSTQNASDVAALLGRTTASILYRAKRLGVSFQKCGADHPRTIHSNEDVDLIRDLYDEGISLKDISVKFEISYRTVLDIVRFNRRLYPDTAFRFKSGNAKNYLRSKRH